MNLKLILYDIFTFDNDANSLENMIGEKMKEDDFQTDLPSDFNNNFGLK